MYRVVRNILVFGHITCAVLLFSLTLPYFLQKADAALLTSAQVPYFLVDYNNPNSMPRLCADNGVYVGQAIWISEQNNPLRTTISINIGDPYAYLQYNIAVYRCIDGQTTQINSTVYRTINGSYTYNSITPQSMPEFSGATVTVASPATTGPEFSYEAIPFRVPTGGFINDTFLSVSVNSQQYNNFISGGYTACIVPPGYTGPDIRPIPDITNCPIAGVSQSVWIDVSVNPLGTVDAASCNAISGWSFDYDNTNASVPIHVYIDGPAGLGSLYRTGTANTWRPDVNAAYGIGGNHGFDIAMNPNDFGGPRALHAYAINIDAAGNPTGGPNIYLGTRTAGPCAPVVRIQGQIFNASTGQGVAGVELETCTLGAASTGTVPGLPGYVYLNATAGQYFCLGVRTLPAGYSGWYIRPVGDAYRGCGASAEPPAPAGCVNGRYDNQMAGGFVGNGYDRNSDVGYDIGLIPSAPPSVNGALCEASGTTGVIRPNQPVTAFVRVRNTGTTNWVASGSNAHRLGEAGLNRDTGNTLVTQVPGLHRAAMSSNVAPGGTMTFNFTIPGRPSGNVSASYQMVHENVQWFGGICALNYVVPFYYPFTLTPLPQAVGLNDAESPTSVTFNDNIGMSFSAPGNPGRVNGATYRREFYRLRGATQTPLASSPINSSASLSFSPFPLGPEVRTIPAGFLVAGDSVCSRLTIFQTQGTVDSSGNIVSITNGASSRVECALIVDRPYFRVYDADVVTGSGFGVNCSGLASAGITTYNTYRGAGPNNWAGSGGQLGVFSRGPISGFHSLIWAAFPAATANGTKFANTSSPQGNFGQTFCAEDYWANRPVMTQLARGAYVASDFSGPVLLEGGSTLTSAHFADAQHVAVYVNGDITITNDIITTVNSGRSFASLADFPSLYIIASGNIYIRSGVTDVNAILIAQQRSADPNNSGRIFTCTGTNNTPPSNGDLVGACRTTRLTVKGVLVAHKVIFARGLGSLRSAVPQENYLSTNSGNGNNTAEIIKYAPELMIGVPAIPPRGVDSYDSIISLPPSL